MKRRKFIKKTIVYPIGISAFGFAGKIKASDSHISSSNIQNKFSALSSVNPLVRVVDLDIGEKTIVKLYDGSAAEVKLLSVEGHRDSVFDTLYEALVKVELNGEVVNLISSSYRLPVTVGRVQVDVPTVQAYMKDSSLDWWRLKKAVRLRFWPAGSPWIEEGTFKYPVKQRWLASETWYSNEAVSPVKPGHVYYHAPMDLGGVEGLTEIVAATDGIVIVLGDKSLNDDSGLKPIVPRARYDIIYIKDKRGWIYRYSHLKSLDPSLSLGGNVKTGQRLGYMGKEGGSGGWVHLHFQIAAIQPSGELGVEDSYAFLWQAYREEYDPEILAVARPHKKVLAGETILLDASRSWAKKGIRSFEWIFNDGTRTIGAKVKRVYNTPGAYSELVKITDKEGNVDYGFVRVSVYPKKQKDTTEAVAHSIPRLHTAHHPTFGIKPGDPVIFSSRVFNTKQQEGVDVYDFGDGSPKVSVPTNIDSAKHAANGYGTTVHHYQKPGHYIVSVERLDEKTGYVAMQHLHVVVELCKS